MQCDLRWIASVPASGLHAAAAIDRGFVIADDELENSLSPQVDVLQHLINGTSIPREPFWRHVVPLSATIDSTQHLAEVVLRKILNPGQLSSIGTRTLVETLSAMEHNMRRAVPGLVDELAQRAGPLRAQWKAHGVGLLSLIAQLTEQQLIVPQADVVLVHPTMAGGGEAHLFYNSVRIEVVPEGPQSQLPELVRLGWMVSQLNNDLPVHSEMIHAETLPLISNLAMLPPTLSAAEQLGLARYDIQTVRLAIAAWHIRGPAGVDLAESVTQWWDIYSASPPQWSVALTALSRMIQQYLAGVGS